MSEIRSLQIGDDSYNYSVLCKTKLHGWPQVLYDLARFKRSGNLK